MKRLWHKTIPTLIIALMTFTASLQQAHAVVQFADASPLAQGKWVKIHINKTGIYELSFSELREMGFSDPAKVAVFGRGGMLQNENFTDQTGNQLYSDDIKPAATTIIGDKIYFYAVGPSNVKSTGNTAGKLFERVEPNVYSDGAWYFLTDFADRLQVSLSDVATDTSLPDYTCGWDYFYHEKDLCNPARTGNEFFGESLLDASARRLEIPFSIPGAVTDGTASIECRFIGWNDQRASVLFGVQNADASQKAEFTSTVAAKPTAVGNTEIYRYSSPDYYSFSMPADAATAFVEYKPASGVADMALLDYIIIGAQKNLFFPGDAPSMRAFTFDYSSAEHGALAITGLPDGAQVWDVVSSNDIKSLPYTTTNGVAEVIGYSDNRKDGVLMAFDPSKEQNRIDRYESITSTNLHALGNDGIPDMLIITLPDYKWAADEIAALHRTHDGLDVAVALSSDIVNEFAAGTPDPMAYRALCKMLYDRDDSANRKFRSVLLLGPMHYDHRGAVVSREGEFLICPQSKTGNKLDGSFSLTDSYGTLADYYSPVQSDSYFHMRPLDIAVAVLTCESDNDCHAIIDKISRYLNDDSFAYWLADAQYVADWGDNNEHQLHCEDLTEALTDLSDNEFVARKAYINGYPKGQIPYVFAQNLTDGQIISTYVGHASPRSMSGDFWGNQHLNMLTNKRLSFMLFAGCSISEFDLNDRGTGERLIFYKDHGLIGGILTNRTAYSNSNKKLMLNFQRAMLFENPLAEESQRLSTPRSFGEIYRLGKNQYYDNTNKLTYHLMADPALVPPLPTSKIILSLPESDGTTLAPGSSTKIQGSITDYGGRLLSDFSGTAVVKLYAPPVSRMTKPTDTKVSPAMSVRYDENALITVPFTVVNGVFEGILSLPAGIDLATAENPTTLRVAAFNPATRRSSIGLLNVEITESENPEADTEAPVITGMQVDENGILTATVADNRAIAISSASSPLSASLQIDNCIPAVAMAGYSVYSHEGRSCEIRYPLGNLAPGSHTLALRVSDLDGNTSEQHIVFTMPDSKLQPVLCKSPGPVRRNVTFTVTSESTGASSAEKYRFSIIDAAGVEMFATTLSDNSFDWDVKDNDGRRLSPGVYYAICRAESGVVSRGVSAPLRLIVLDD